MTDCDVIRDLLPLYADDLASAHSRALIEAHVKECDACRSLMERMCAPMEPEPVDEAQAYARSVRVQKRKNRWLLAFACGLTALVCLVGYWLYMEYHFSGKNSVVTSTDPEMILSEMPELELTAAEKELAHIIMENPAIQKALGMEQPVEIPPEQVRKDMTEILPEGASALNIGVIGRFVYIDYTLENRRVILEYADGDQAGGADAIRKSVGVLEPEDNHVDTLYVAEYVLALDKTWYEKQSSQHVWFSFLNQP